jgi:hypothetical protein
MTNLPGVAPVRRALSELVGAGIASQPWRETIGKTGRENPLCRGFRLLQFKFAMHIHIYECSIRLGNFSRFSLFYCVPLFIKAKRWKSFVVLSAYNCCFRYLNRVSDITRCVDGALGAPEKQGK